MEYQDKRIAEAVPAETDRAATGQRVYGLKNLTPTVLGQLIDQCIQRHDVMIIEMCNDVLLERAGWSEGGRDRK